MRPRCDLSWKTMFWSAVVGLILWGLILYPVFAHDTYVAVKEAWGEEVYRINECDQRDLKPGQVVTIYPYNGTGCLRVVQNDDPSIGIVIRVWSTPKYHHHYHQRRVKTKKKMPPCLGIC